MYPGVAIKPAKLAEGVPVEPPNLGLLAHRIESLSVTYSEWRQKVDMYKQSIELLQDF